MIDIRLDFELLATGHYPFDRVVDYGSNKFQILQITLELLMLFQALPATIEDRLSRLAMRLDCFDDIDHVNIAVFRPGIVEQVVEQVVPIDQEWTGMI